MIAVNPLRQDPTRTKILREKFQRDLRVRYAHLKKRIFKLLVDQDIFGLKKQVPTVAKVVGNSREFWSIQLNFLEHTLLTQIQTVQKRLLPQDILELELDTHVTLRFGFTEEPDEVAVRHIVESYGDLQLSFGSFGIFSNEEQDILYLEVESPQLHKINKDLGVFKHIQSEHSYKPHLTVAYLKRGTGNKYATSKWLPRAATQRPYLGPYRIVKSSPEREQETITANVREWESLSDADKIARFAEFIEQSTTLSVLPQSDDFWEAYVQAGYLKGASRAFEQVRKAKRASDDFGLFSSGAKSEFLDAAISAPESIEKVKLLSARTYTDLKGVTDVTATQLRKELVDGLVQGENPRTIARKISTRLDLSRNRSETIARTEVIRAHSEGQLDAMERMGIEEVGVAVEWQTARDNRVCKLCQDLDGIVLKIKEAHNMIPRHPNCRCAFVPANVGEDKAKQIRTSSAIQARIKRSAKREGKDSDWAGRATKVDKGRPVSILDDDPKREPTKPKTKKPTKLKAKKATKPPTKPPTAPPTKPPTAPKKPNFENDLKVYEETSKRYGIEHKKDPNSPTAQALAKQVLDQSHAMRKNHPSVTVYFEKGKMKVIQKKPVLKKPPSLPVPKQPPFPPVKTEYKQAYKEWKGGLSAAEKEGIEYWSESVYTVGDVRDYEKGLAAKEPEKVKAFLGAVEKAPKYKGTTYRGQAFDGLEDLKVGQEFKFGHAVSASKDIDVGDEFALMASDFTPETAVQFEIKHKGKGGVDISTLVSEEYLDQEEVFIKSDSKFKIKSKNKSPNGDWTDIVLEEI